MGTSQMTRSASQMCITCDENQRCIEQWLRVSHSCDPFIDAVSIWLVYHHIHSRQYLIQNNKYNQTRVKGGYVLVNSGARQRLVKHTFVDHANSFRATWLV